MDGEADQKSDRIKLDKLVAISVVILPVFMAVSRFKDDNLVHADLPG